MIKDLLDQAKQKMEKAVEVVFEDLKTVEVGRARPALVETIKVSAYEGAVLTIRELASITAPSPDQIVISPWDKTIVKKIAQAISSSDLKLSPLMEEDLIRLKVPSLTEERRKELVKLVQMKVEGGRRMIREIRNQIKEEIEALEGKENVSEDDIFRGKGELQKLHDDYVGRIEKLGKRKNTEIKS